MPYVVTEPICGVYETWAGCQAALNGLPGARRLMEVTSLEEGEAILHGGVLLEPGLYAFTDGNARGGVGVVVVRTSEGENAEPRVIWEKSTSVAQVFRDARIPSLDADAVDVALDRLVNILAEMAALYVALSHIVGLAEARAGSSLTIVHDYLGVAAWMQDRWREAKDPELRKVVSACLELAGRRSLELRFRHQPGHRSEWAGRHHFVRFNVRADELATRGSEHKKRV